MPGGDEAASSKAPASSDNRAEQEVEGKGVLEEGSEVAAPDYVPVRGPVQYRV